MKDASNVLFSGRIFERYRSKVKVDLKMTSAWVMSCTVLVELTTNGTSTCRLCKSRIITGKLRIGLWFHHTSGSGFVMIEWQHWSCCAWQRIPSNVELSIVEKGLSDETIVQIQQHFYQLQQFRRQLPTVQEEDANSKTVKSIPPTKVQSI